MTVVSLAGAGWGSVLFAQDDDSGCARIAAPAERLACYDRAVPPMLPAPATSGAPASSAAEPSASVTVAAPTAPDGSTDGERLDVLRVVVVGMRKYPGRSATFTTDKGDVLVQIGGEGVYLPKVPFDAELRPASMGTYFLRPREFGWRVHVRRDD